MSQLGMMVIAVGLSSYNVALFHLVNHAFYKGLLFLAAGSVIHAVGDNQDFRKYGGLRLFLPLTYSVMVIASLSLVAFTFMTGFYSKDIFIGLGTGFFMDNSLYINPYHEITIETEFAVPTFFKLLPLFCTIFFTFLSILYSEVLPSKLISFKLSRIGYNIFGFFSNRF